MFDIGPIGAAGDAPTVQEQFKPLVGADVQAQGRGGGVKRAAETQQHGLAPTAGKIVGMRHAGRIPEIRMPDPRGGVNGLDRYNARVAQVQARREPDLLDHGCLVCRHGIGKSQQGGQHAPAEAPAQF